MINQQLQSILDEKLPYEKLPFQKAFYTPDATRLSLDDLTRLPEIESVFDIKLIRGHKSQGPSTIRRHEHGRLSYPTIQDALPSTVAHWLFAEYQISAEGLFISYLPPNSRRLRAEAESMSKQLQTYMDSHFFINPEQQELQKSAKFVDTIYRQFRQPIYVTGDFQAHIYYYDPGRARAESLKGNAKIIASSGKVISMTVIENFHKTKRVVFDCTGNKPPYHLIYQLPTE